jgi:glycerol uptake facilitator-like aquaporin
LRAASLRRRALAEGVGTAFLVAIVVGSGITASDLVAGSATPALLVHAVVTAAGLGVLVVALRPVSGAHLNPVVSLVERVLGRLTTQELGTYVVAQATGGAVGAAVANVMFGEPVLAWASTARNGPGLWLGEIVATMGLLLVVCAVASGAGATVAPLAVGAYVGAAACFTSSGGFANPAVTLARTVTDTFAGIQPASAVAFVVAQAIGAGAAITLVRALHPLPRSAPGAAAGHLIPRPPTREHP